MATFYVKFMLLKELHACLALPDSSVGFIAARALTRPEADALVAKLEEMMVMIHFLPTI